MMSLYLYTGAGRLEFEDEGAKWEQHGEATVPFDRAPFEMYA